MSGPAAILLACVLASACSQPQTQSEPPETLSMQAGVRPVFASPNARRYHKDRTCKELTRTNSRMSVADARKQGMLPCPTVSRGTNRPTENACGNAIGSSTNWSGHG